MLNNETALQLSPGRLHLLIAPRRLGRQMNSALIARVALKTRDRERIVCKARTGPCKREVREEKEPESVRERILVKLVSETISQDGATIVFQTMSREQFVL